MAGGPADAKGLLLSAIQDPDPVIFFEPKMMYDSHCCVLSHHCNMLDTGDAFLQLDASFKPGDSHTAAVDGRKTTWPDFMKTIHVSLKCFP